MSNGALTTLLATLTLALLYQMARIKIRNRQTKSTAGGGAAARG